MLKHGTRIRILKEKLGPQQTIDLHGYICGISSQLSETTFYIIELDTESRLNLATSGYHYPCITAPDGIIEQIEGIVE